MMKKIKLLSALALVVLVLPLVLSCSKDDESSNIAVVIYDNGKTSNGSTFFAIDEKNFYLDHIKYSITEGYLTVTGYDPAGFKGRANIVSRITYKGYSYEVLSVGDYAFMGCINMTSVTIPSSVKSIGYKAFQGCINMTSVTIPSSVTNIGDDAFSGCSGLTSVTIPNNVTKIGGMTFSNCSSISSIKVESDNKTYDSRDNCNAIIETATNTLICGCKNTTIPNGVTSIGEYAFYDCGSLTSVTIPNSVTSIGRQTFQKCI